MANTIDIEMGRDQLRDVDGLARFAAGHGLELRFAPRDLARCRAFREALRDICSAHAGLECPRESVTIVNELLARAPVVVHVDRDGAVAFEPAAGLTGAAALLAAVAAQITTANADGTWERLKACEAHGCRWVYYDRSPAGRSRWCTMSICGSRTKMRAYRKRTQHL